MWEPLPVEIDEDAVTERILDALATRLPGWVPVEGAPEVALAEEIGRETAATNARAATAVELAFAGIGETVFGLPAILGAQATMLVELAVTEAGAVVPAAFTVVGVNADGVEVAFELPEQVSAGAATIAVLMRARDVGVLSNTVAIGPLTVITSTSTVSAASAVDPSTGGVDPESLTAYLGRLVDYIATLRPGGVRAGDLAVLARNITGVHRALGVDLYDPTIPSIPAERTATVFPVDASGLPVSPAVAAEVKQALEAVREVNFVIHVDEPTYTAVQVNFEAVSQTGADPALVQANIHAALVEHLSPARWGSTPGDSTTWKEATTVRYLDLARIAGSAEGVAYLGTLTLNGVTADVVLPGPAALPEPLTGATPSTITGTVA